MGNKSCSFAHTGLALAERGEIRKCVAGNIEVAGVRLLGVRNTLRRLARVVGRRRYENRNARQHQNGSKYSHVHTPIVANCTENMFQTVKIKTADSW